MNKKRIEEHQREIDRLKREIELTKQKTHEVKVDNLIYKTLLEEVAKEYGIDLDKLGLKK